jgi:hypothetical protein
MKFCESFLYDSVVISYAWALKSFELITLIWNALGGCSNRIVTCSKHICTIAGATHGTLKSLISKLKKKMDSYNIGSYPV